MTLQITQRDVPPRAAHALEQQGLHPLLARLFAARGVKSMDDLDDAPAQFLPPQQMKGTPQAAQLLAEALRLGQRVCVVADYDCDGATACAVAVRGLRMLGFGHDQVCYAVPDRAIHGYGLSPAIVDAALAQIGQPMPAVLLTVDNGISAMEGVAYAQALGMKVLVTDHHLPAMLPNPNNANQSDVVLPSAEVIVNPNQPDCSFPSKSMAGVGVMFYVLLALRAELRQGGYYQTTPQPRLDALLDLVALGTVADVVRLDANNRRMVAQGLKRIRTGRLQAGMAALFTVAGRDPMRASAQDFGFAIGPRINAAGRLADMTVGIECLLTDDAARAADLAAQLDQINRERRSVEDGMREQAQLAIERMFDPNLTDSASAPPVLALFDESFHEGVVGIVAGRLKEQLHRPVFVFARGQDGLLKGSGRSIVGFHLRDALDLISKQNSHLILRFGGHAMAAGCTIRADGHAEFAAAFLQVAQQCLDEAILQRRLVTDGALPNQCYAPEFVHLLDAQVWGQGFDAPLFCDRMCVESQKQVGEKHLKLRLRPLSDTQLESRDAIWFNRTEPLPDEVSIAYRLNLNEWQGRTTVQMVVEAAF
jgi:single-stranded-DNA-specific exonuclease